MRKKISIIIPVYNGEKYINRCLDSVLCQTFEEYEILAINDGSQDKSLEILRGYEKNNPGRMKVITQENRGVAETRNRGIQLAKTKYLMFIDQDDFIDPDFCETYYAAAEEGDYDIVLGGFKRPGTGNRMVNKYVPLKDTPYAPYVCTGLWAKLHKTSFVKEHRISVFHTPYGEDIAFTLHEYTKTKNIKVLEGYVGYSWLYNQESVSNTSQKKILNMLPFHLILLDETKKYDISHSAEHEYYILQTVVFFLLWSGRSAKSVDFMYVYREVLVWLNKNYPRFQDNKYIFLGPSGAPKLNRLSIGGFMLMHRLHIVWLFAKVYCKG